MAALLLALGLACQEPVDPGTPTTGVSTATTTTVTTGTSTATTSTSTWTSTTTTTEPDPCDGAVQVLEAAVSQPYGAQAAEVTVTLSAEAPVALRCAAGDDVSLVESPAGTSHTLRVAGLLADTAYTCQVVATCPVSSPVALELTTGSLPTGLPAATTTGPAGPWVLTSVPEDCSALVNHLLVYDGRGRVRWTHRLPEELGLSVEARYHGDDTFVWGGAWGPKSLGRPRVVDTYAGEVYDSAVALTDWERAAFHHDGKMLPDGRLLTLEEVLVRHGVPFEGFKARVVDPALGGEVASWSSQAAVNDGHLPPGEGDAWHANWVDVVDQGGREVLAVSLCNLSEVVAVDLADGTFLWSFGPERGWTLLDPAGNPLPDDDYPQCQHGPELVGESLLVYDNGRLRGQSRVAEYALDTAKKIATLRWSWTEDGWYESTLGDVDWLPDGTVFVSAGHNACIEPVGARPTTFFVLDPVTGERPWSLAFDDEQRPAYRGELVDGCALFANTAACPALAARDLELAPLFAP